MRAGRILLFVLLSFFVITDAGSAQLTIPACNSTAPPKYLLLVHQEFPVAKSLARQKLSTEVARDFDRLKIPNCWIELEAWTGAPGALFFDSFDSLAQLEHAHGYLTAAYGKNPALAGSVQRILDLMTSMKTLIAARRDDLSYRWKNIDLSRMRYLRIVVVRLRQGRESDFTESFKLLAAAYEKINSPNPWMVYQVDSGIPRPTFFVMVPMTHMAEMDTLLANATSVRAAEGEAGADRIQEITRQAYESVEVQMYVVSPQTSHVLPAFAASDPAFWIQPPPPPPIAPTKKRR